MSKSSMPHSWIMDVTAANGVPFRVLVHPSPHPYRGILPQDHLVVEFYDRRWDFSPAGYGQFTGARYMIETLRERGTDRGLDLVGYVPDWKIDKVTWSMIHQWLSTITE